MTDPQEAPVTDLLTNPTTSVMVDAALLEEARRQLSMSSSDDVINEALRRLVEAERAKRRAALEELQQMHDEGRFDYSQLEGADE